MHHKITPPPPSHLFYGARRQGTMYDIIIDINVEIAFHPVPIQFMIIPTRPLYWSPNAHYHNCCNFIRATETIPEIPEILWEECLGLHQHRHLAELLPTSLLSPRRSFIAWASKCRPTGCLDGPITSSGAPLFCSMHADRLESSNSVWLWAGITEGHGLFE